MAPRRAGVTLVELLVALVLLGILAGAALPRLDPAAHRADAGMRQVRGALQQAQRIAVQHQYDVVVSFDVRAGSIRVAEDSTNDRVIAGERVRWLPLDPGVRFVRPASPVPGGVGGAEVAGPGVRSVDGLPSVVFRRSGAASGDLEVYLAAARRGAGDDVRAVTVVHGTGRTAWFRLTDRGWTGGEL